MLSYFVLLGSLVLSKGLFEYLGFSALTAMVLKAFLLLILIVLFRKDLPFRLRFDGLTFLVGIGVILFWIGYEYASPWIPEHMPGPEFTVPEIAMRVLISVMFAPFIEEVFTRYFLSRAVLSKDWQKIKEGTFTFSSFIITTLFFGLSHSRIIQGLVAGAVYNFLYLKRKDIGYCITAHAISNLVLAVFILISGDFGFW